MASAETGLPAPTLESARQLLDDAGFGTLVPYSRTPLVDYVVASVLLEKYLVQQRPTGERLAAFRSTETPQPAASA